MIGTKTPTMYEDDRGKKFLELIDEQNTIQWNMVSNLMKLIESGWNLPDVKKELESLVEKHTQITRTLNELDKTEDAL